MCLEVDKSCLAWEKNEYKRCFDGNKLVEGKCLTLDLSPIQI